MITKEAVERVMSPREIEKREQKRERLAESRIRRKIMQDTVSDFLENGGEIHQIWSDTFAVPPKVLKQRKVREESKYLRGYVAFNRETGSIGLSICNPEDSFCKLTGRYLAVGRAVQSHEAVEESEANLNAIIRIYFEKRNPVKVRKG